VNLSDCARIWRAGCIIRAALIDDIMRAIACDPPPPNLPLHPEFTQAVTSRQGAWRRGVALAATHGIPRPAVSASLACLASYRTGRLRGNLDQAQRDYVGAPTYARVDREGIFHTEWRA